MLFGENNLSLRRSLITYCSILTLFIGVVLILKGVAGEGTIDVNMAFVQGKLQSGSIGILFSFLAFLLLVVCYTHQTGSKMELKRTVDGSITLSHKGSLSSQKVKNIRFLLDGSGEEQKQSTNPEVQPTE